MQVEQEQPGGHGTDSPMGVGSSSHLPSVQSYFRMKLGTGGGPGLLDRATSLLESLLWLRDRQAVNQIRAARTAEALVDCAPLATGLGEKAWNEQLRRFGPELLPVIAERLALVRELAHAGERALVQERLIAALRWQGEEGGRLLHQIFDGLDEYGQSLASIVLGLLGAAGSADRIWAYYKQVSQDRSASFFIGALWGLTDLGDSRAGEALAELLQQGALFFELPALLAMAGDERVLVPLLLTIPDLPAEGRSESYMALLAIAHRTGRERLMAELDRAAPIDDCREEWVALVDAILAKPVAIAEDYFSIYYPAPSARFDEAP